MKVTLKPDEVKKDFTGRFCKYLYSLERMMLQVHVDKGQRTFWACTVEGGQPRPMKGGLLRLDVSLLDEHGESIELRNKDGYNA
jgi:hypothetical protein